METTEAARPAATWAMPMAVGALLLLYGLALLLMSEDATPVVLLVAVLGAAALGWGYYQKNRND